MVPTPTWSLFAIAMLSPALGCQPTRTPEGLPMGPVCVAHNAEEREATCPAPPDTYDGDNCTCVDAVTGQAFVGRVRGGM